MQFCVIPRIPILQGVLPNGWGYSQCNLGLANRAEFPDEKISKSFDTALADDQFEFLNSLELNEMEPRTLLKNFEKKLNGNYTRILHAVLNKSWKQHPTKQQLYDHLPPILQIIQVRWARYTGHYWESKDKHMIMFSRGYTSIGQPVETYRHQLCPDSGCRLEDLPRAMDNWDW